MNLKNEALQELYDTLTYGPILSSPYTESPIDRAFKECDEKLSESATFKVIKDIQNRCDNLERSNKALRDDNDKLGDKIIELKKDLDAKDKENSTLVSANADLSDRNSKLQRNFDRINHLWTGQIQENMELRSKIANLQREKKNYETIAKERADLLIDRDGWRSRALEAEKRVGELLLKKYDQAFEDLKKELDDAKKQLNYFTHSRDDWRARAKHAEDEVSGANKQIKALKEFNSEITSKNVDLAARNVELARKNELLEAKVLETTETLEKVNSDRNSCHGLYTELRKDYDKLFEDNRKLKARTDCHRYEVEWYRKHYKEKSDKIGELKKQLGELISQYQKLTIENKRLQNNVRSGYDQGQTDLWVKLQNVNNSQPFELATCFPDVTGMEDILNWDLEDFLDAYKKWWEEKEKDRLDHMRDYLARFCEGRLCKGCPLESNEYKCGNGYSFRKFDRSDDNIIPDEDIKRYYEKARGCGQYTLKDAKLFATTVEGVNRAISKACEGFCEAVLDADNKITENLRKGCTLEAKVEVNKDLDYGDAVRVPWRDYDYMYIGPEGNHIRLFDPKTHTVVVVSVRDNLTYQGCKIILCDEDDIIKIWKVKK